MLVASRNEAIEREELRLHVRVKLEVGVKLGNKARPVEIEAYYQGYDLHMVHQYSQEHRQIVLLGLPTIEIGGYQQDDDQDSQ